MEPPTPLASSPASAEQAEPVASRTGLPRRGLILLFGFAFVLRLALMVQLFFVTARNRVLLVPFLLIFAAEGGLWLLRG
jgi:hypothetical protein